MGSFLFGFQTDIGLLAVQKQGALVKPRAQVQTDIGLPYSRVFRR